MPLKIIWKIWQSQRLKFRCRAKNHDHCWASINDLEATIVHAFPFIMFVSHIFFFNLSRVWSYSSVGSQNRPPSHLRNLHAFEIIIVMKPAIKLGCDDKPFSTDFGADSRHAFTLYCSNGQLSLITVLKSRNRLDARLYLDVNFWL